LFILWLINIIKTKSSLYTLSLLVQLVCVLSNRI
jgi:hypothetical protein